MKSLVLVLSVVIGVLVLPDSVGAGVACNDSYTTLCAEMDNINIPITHTGAAAYRVTVTHPEYFPSSISNWSADFTDCTFGGRGIWAIGTNDGSSAEFMQGFSFTNGDTYFAQDTPTAGVDEAVNLFPREINNDWMPEQHIQFTTDEDEDVNLEVRIGSKLTVALAQISGTLEIQARTQTTNGWVVQGTQVFHSTSMTGTWNIADLTWMEGVDTNVIQLQVVRAGDSTNTTTNAWAYYDYLELTKRDEAGDNSGSPTVLYADSNTIVETIHIDFWWRYPEAMTVSALGGTTDTNVHFLRIKRRMPQTSSSWNEIFVLYEDGNARIIPLPPVGLGAVPYGASLILGPTTNSPRPFAEIESVTVDPLDLSLDIVYGEGGSSHVELRANRTEHIVDVSDILYDTTNSSFCRFRSMWVRDGKTDVDRVRYEDGTFPIMNNWTNLAGSWWQFFRDVPSYHNTYCPDFRVRVIDAAVALYRHQAESNSWGSNCWPVSPRTNASNGQALSMGGSGAETVYSNINLSADHSGVDLIVRYAVTNGGDGIDNLANSLRAVVDGVYTSKVVYAVTTGGRDEYEMLPAMHLGSLGAGAHELRLISGPGTNGFEIDSIEWVSSSARGWIKDPLLFRECETFDWATNWVYTSRTGGVAAVHLEHAGANQEAAASFNLFFTNHQTNVYLRLRYSDDLGPTKIQVLVDDELRAQFPTESTGSWDSFDDSPAVFLGTVSTGWHELKFDVSNETWGVDLDFFEIHAWVDNQSPAIDLTGLPVFPVGAGSNFHLIVTDVDGDEVLVSNPQAPTNASFVTNFFAWAPTTEYEGSTNIIVFVGNDQRGLTNSIATNSASIQVPLDFDTDAMRDGWEWIQFGSLTNEGGGDVDGDGADNYSEFIAGTDATNVGSFFAVDALVASTGASNRHITVPTMPGRTYTIHYNDQALAEGVMWTSFARAHAGVWFETNEAADTHTFVDDEGTNTTWGPSTNWARFYKISVQYP